MISFYSESKLKLHFNPHFLAHNAHLNINSTFAAALSPSFAHLSIDFRVSSKLTFLHPTYDPNIVVYPDRCGQHASPDCCPWTLGRGLRCHASQEGCRAPRSGPGAGLQRLPIISKRPTLENNTVRKLLRNSKSCVFDRTQTK